MWSCFPLTGCLLFQFCDCTPRQSLARESHASRLVLTENFLEYMNLLNATCDVSLWYPQWEFTEE